MRFRRFLTPRVVAAAIAVVVLVAVFGGTFVAPKSGLLPPPSAASDTTPDATTTTVDHSGIALPVVDGAKAAIPLVETGRATILGVVDGPQGRLPGAVVRLERLVGDQVQRVDVATAGDGTFRVEGIPGGRYRVRTWLVPLLVQAEPEVFFLADGGERELALRAEQLDEVLVRASTRPETPIVGDGVNIAVLVADRVIDADGVAQTQPRAGVPVALSVSGLAAVAPGAVRVTDGTGVAVFEFSCESVGSVSATALVGAAAGATDPPTEPPTSTTPTDPTDPTTGIVDEVVSLEIPPCAPIPTTTTAPTTTTPGDDVEDSTTTSED